jgi:hypothetical protein
MGYYDSDGDWNTEDAPRVFGDVEFIGKDIAVSAQKFDRIAVSGANDMLLLSVAGELHNIKRMRAILCGGVKASINGGGVRINQPNGEQWRARQPGRMNATPDGYIIHTHRLGYGMMHALFLTRSPGFMKVITPDALWQELKNIRYTTPIIREWMPYIETSLREQELLEDAHVFNCTCGVLSATTKNLDDIVEKGIQQGIIQIPEPDGTFRSEALTLALRTA